jgi:ribosomal protein S18 acetylase RimI-like enzyme
MDDSAIALARRLEQSVSMGPPPDDCWVVDVGSFRAFFAPHSDEPELNYAMPVASLGASGEDVPAVESLRRAFGDRQRALRFEFFQGLWPTLPAILEQAGLRLAAAEPLMFCTPADLVLVAARGVTVRLLTAADPDADLTSYLSIRDEDPNPPPAGEMAWLREALRVGRGRFALASLAGTPAGTGRCLPLGDGLGEITAIVTLAALRRHGVAATLTSFLVRDHFNSGGTLAWLNAADARAQAVYHRIGFRDLDTLLNYMDPHASG